LFFNYFRLAFLPPEPTYSLHVVDSHTPINGIIDEKISSTKKSQADSDIPIRYSIKFSDKAEWQHSHSDITKLEPYFVTTSRHNRIACLYVNCTSNPKYHILFSHGNAVDLGRILIYMKILMIYLCFFRSNGKFFYCIGYTFTM
jgi:hypothetical protein